MSNDLSTLLCQFSPAVQTELSAAVAEAYTLPDIENAASCETANKCSTRISKAVKAVEKERLEFTRKIDAVKKRATDYEKTVTKEAIETMGLIDGAVKAYLAGLEEERIRREAAARAQEEAQAATEGASEGEERLTAPLVAAEPMVEAPKLPTRRVPRIVYTDINCIPRDYLVVDEKKLLEDLKNGKTVPGAALGYEEVLVHR